MKLNASKEVLAIINTSAEINVILKDLAIFANLLVNLEVRISIVAATSDRRALVGVCKGVKVRISYTLVLTHLFIITSIKSQLILSIL